MPVLEHAVYTACPEGWIGFGRKCFYFSEDIRNWTYSQAFCASVDADLTRPETLEELVNVFGSFCLFYAILVLFFVKFIGGDIV